MSNKAIIKLIVGLGNPGPTYEDTRHNAGAWFVKQIAAQNNQTVSDKTKFHGMVGKVEILQHAVQLLIPTTFMNLSGQAVSAVATFYNITPAEILVAHDEIDLPVGTVRYKFDGGHGGHNGLRDIIKAVGSTAFYRLRIGVGRPDAEHDVADYVLHRPSKTEQTLIDAAMLEALGVLPDVISGHVQRAMHELHSIN